MGLSKIENATISRALEKQAGEGSTDNNIMRLISDEVYSQLSEKFPNIIPYIVGVNMVEKIDDKHALGAAKLVLPIGTASIPVVYSEGKVDATTFLYNEETDLLLALTKKSVKMLVDETGELIGSPVTDGDVNADTGNIHSLFVPPKTYNPKIASHGMLFQVLEQDGLLKEAFAKRLQDPKIAESYTKVYGDEIVKYITYGQELEKEAKYEDQNAETLHTMSSVLASSWLHKEAAAIEFAQNGFAISHGTKIPTMSLVKESTVATDLTASTGMTSFQTIMQQESGVFEVYKTSDLSPMKVLVTRDLSSSSGVPIVLGKIRGIHSSPDHQPIGRKQSIEGCSIFKDISTAQSGGHIALFKDGTLFGVHRLGFSGILSKEDSADKTVLVLNSGSIGIGNIIIEKNSSRSPVVSKRTIYVGSENIKYVPREDGKLVDVVTMYDISTSAQLDNGRLVKVAFDGFSYIHEGQSLSKVAFVNKLVDEGYDKGSIYSLVKTAGKEGSTEVVAISAKIDMLTNMIMNLAGTVQAQSQAAPTPAPEAGLAGIPQPGAPQPEVPQPGMESSQMPPGGGLSLPDNSGMPMGDQPVDQEALAQEQAMLGQDGAPMQEGTPAQEEAQGQEVPNGMNPNIDPEVLNMLSGLKDSSVMDVGVIADMADSSRISSIISENKGKIAEGASSMGRILLNMMSGRAELTQTMGEKKFNKVTSNLKAMFVKTTDLYVDIMKMDVDAGNMGS